MFYARFERIRGHIFRFDTRIYLGEHDIADPGRCVGAIVAKNPGSAKHTRLGVLTDMRLEGDKMLPTVFRRFSAAFRHARRGIPKNAYVQVWNLFYLCNPKLDAACQVVAEIRNPPLCQSEIKRPNITWFAWGGDSRRLNPFKARFLSRRYVGTFFYSKADNAVIRRMPSISDRAKHPQGMPEDPIVEHLTRVL